MGKSVPGEKVTAEKQTVFHDVSVGTSEGLG